MTTKKGCNPGKQPKRVVKDHMSPTQAEIAERAAEIRKGWQRDDNRTRTDRFIKPVCRMGDGVTVQQEGRE